MDPKWTLFLSLSGACVTLIALHIPLSQGRIKPNDWYGLRIKATLEDPEIWYPANARAANTGIGISIILLILLILSLPLGVNLYTSLNLMAFLAAMIWWVYDSIRYAIRLSQAKRNGIL